MSKVETLVAKGFRFNKALGQNFISDTNLLRAIVSDAEVGADDTVVEIGAGAGTLTAEIAAAARKVIAFEIDKNLIPFLQENFSGSSVDIKHMDILKTPHNLKSLLVHGEYGNDYDKDIDCKCDNISGDSYKSCNSGGSKCDKTVEFSDSTAGQKRFKVVANLPYYITTPVIFHFLESGLAVDSITIMVQEEVARRIVARPRTADYGALSVAVAARCNAKITRLVSRNMFTPRPNVDSAVVRLKIEREYDPILSKVIKTLFVMRRKTAVNNLTAAGISKAVIEDVFAELKLPPLSRGEEFDVDVVRGIKDGLCARGVKI